MGIDALEGRELSLEIARKLGWPVYSKEEYDRMVDENDYLPDMLIVGDCPIFRYTNMVHTIYNPYEDLEKAMLLDRSSYCMELYVDLNLNVMCCFQDFDRKALLYASKKAPQLSQVIQTMATCVCRCWLKMMEE